MSLPRLTAIFVYPLKSAGGISLSETPADATGLLYDRRWMLVDTAGRFLTQRAHARMALLRTALLDASGTPIRTAVGTSVGWAPGGGSNGTTTGTSGREPLGGASAVILRVSAPGITPLDLPVGAAHAGDANEVAGSGDEGAEGGAHLAEGERIPVWGKERYAVSCGPEAAEWASSFLGLPCRMVRAAAPPGLPRVDGRGRVRAGFADAYPALVLSTASLEDLNARLPQPLPMDRFRPNLVVTGVPAYAEDGWERARVGGGGDPVTLRAAKPCYRCVITTTDQETGARGKEPLRTLATYRRDAGGEVAFGLNVGFEAAGTLCVGDPVEAIGPS